MIQLSPSTKLLDPLGFNVDVLFELPPGCEFHHLRKLIGDGEEPPRPAARVRKSRRIEPAAHALGLRVQVLNANTPREIDAAFATLVRERLDALFLAADPFFTSRRVQLANLATRHIVPMISATREVPEAGGLISYGANISDGWRQMGVYVGRILRGTKPADLPVVQSTKFELVINAQTARILGLEVPPTLLARADEVIE